MKTYTEAELRVMDDDQLMEIAIDQMGLGGLSEAVDSEMPETQEERDSLIQTILDAQND